jgi:hypothetical protein
MRAPKKQIAARKAQKLRSWGRPSCASGGEYFGTVEAPDLKTAQGIAVKQFGLEGQRLVAREEAMAAFAKSWRGDDRNEWEGR